MYRDIKLLVDEKYHEKRVDQFLKAKFPAASRNNIKDAFLSRCIFINGREARKGQILCEGDRILIKKLESKRDIRYWPNLIYGPRVIFKDEYYAALYKPPFIHTLPKSFGEKDTLANYAAYMFTSDLDDDFARPPLFLSRLDFETSGLVLLARSEGVYRSLKKSQEKGEILKVYSLLVEGEIDRETIVTKAIITTGKGKVRVDKKRDFSDEKYHTRFIPEKVFPGYSLLRAEIRKGRMHQIRAHAAFSGFPVVGDVKYGGKVFPPMSGLPLRPLLHSTVLDFTHVMSDVRLKINCPHPEDLYRVLVHLQDFSDSSR